MDDMDELEQELRCECARAHEDPKKLSEARAVLGDYLKERGLYDDSKDIGHWINHDSRLIFVFCVAPDGRIRMADFGARK